MKCARLLLRATPLRPESSRAARPFVCGARAASVASVGTLPIGIIQQQARFRCGHGCCSRRAFLFPSPPMSTVIAAWSRTDSMFCLFWQLCGAGRLDALLRIIVACICRNGSRGRLASCCRQETTSNISGYSDAQHVHLLNHQNTT